MLKAETETERRLVGLLGALVGMAPDLLDLAMRAAEVDKEELLALVENAPDPDRFFSCTMWNVMNHAVGAKMVSHQQILSTMRKGESRDGDVS